MKLNSLINLTFLSQIATGKALSTTDGPLNIAISATLGSKSHVKYLFEISQILISRGHSITYLCSEATLKFSKDYNISHIIVSDDKIGLVQNNWKPYNSEFKGIEPSFGIIKKVANTYSQSFINHETFYKEQKPDLIICDWLSPSCTDSAAKFSIPMIIGYQSYGFVEKVPYQNIINRLEPTTIENYSFFQRFARGIIHPFKYIIKFYDPFNELKRVRNEKGISSTPKFAQFKNMGLGIANSYIGLENPISLPSNVYLIGPILPERVQLLSSDLQSYLDIHQKILYIAFGSLINFSSDLATNFLQHFQKLLNDGWIDGIVWGGIANTNLEEFPKTYTVDSIEYSTEPILNGTHRQFKLLDWAPQVAILNHPHTKLFMTHGGLDSIYESIISGTPMLVVPYIGDQSRNSVLIKEIGIGDYIEWPIDNDALINQKFVNLLNPSNLKLKSKLDQHQKIIKFSSNRKIFTADLIETYAYSAKTCRLLETPKSFEIPCEVKPFLPLDHKINWFKANLVDVYLVAIVLLLTAVGLLAFIAIKAVSNFFTIYNKQKKD